MPNSCRDLRVDPDKRPTSRGGRTRHFGSSHAAITPGWSPTLPSPDYGRVARHPLPRDRPATTAPPNVYNISGFHSSTEVDESDVERHLGNDRAKPSNLRNLCGAAIPAAQFHPPSRG